MAPPSVRSAGPTLLVAAVFLVVVELLRAASPLLDLASADLGVVGAARLALVIYAAPALVGLLVVAGAMIRAGAPSTPPTGGDSGVAGAPAQTTRGIPRALAGAVGALVVLRLVAQLQSPPTLLVVGAGAAVGIAALILAARQCSGVSATVGVLLGSVADLAIRAGFGSWDVVFRPGAWPWLVTLAMAALMVAALLAARPTAGGAPAGRVWVLGPYLALYLMGYGSAPILAGQAGVSAPLAAAVLMLTAVAGMELVRRARLPGGSGAIPEPESARGSGAGALAVSALGQRSGVLVLLGVVGGVVAAYWLTGPLVLAVMAVTGLSAAVLLARALTPRQSADAAQPAGQPAAEPAARPAAQPGAQPVAEPAAQPAAQPVAEPAAQPVAEPAAQPPARPAAVGYAGAGLAAGLGYVLPVMIYQIHYDLEFPFDNRLALVAAAVLLGLAGLGARPGVRDGDRQRLVARPAALSVVAALAVLLPVGMAVVRPATPQPDQAGATLRLMSWNVMYGRHHTGGGVDLEPIAAAVEAVDPDLLLLQEVSRGWPIGGGTDIAEWLSRRLRMPYHWAPAANGQFGNVLLTRLPLSDVEAVRLPFVQGPMERSYLVATVQLDGGRELRLINTHLQHRKENTPTRLVQIEALLSEWDGRDHTIIAGDFNFWPSWPEAELWQAAGFQSAQDVTGHGAQFTVPSDDPDNRVDWIFGTPDLTFSDFAILSDVTSSDHFPLVVTVTLS